VTFSGEIFFLQKYLSNNLQKIVSINLKKKQPSKTGCQVKENVEASVEPADLISIVQRLKSTIGFFLLTKRN